MKTNQPTDNRISIIREAFKRIGVRNDKDICRETGMDYNRFHKRRMKSVGTLRLEEFWLLQRHAHFTDAELLEIVKEGGKE